MECERAAHNRSGIFVPFDLVPGEGRRMIETPNPRVVRKLQLLAAVSAGLAFTVGLLVFVGWMFDITLLKTLLPGRVSMKANTALCLQLMGVSLWLQRDRAGFG